MLPSQKLVKAEIRGVTFSRVWAMPNSETFSVAPIGEFVKKYLNGSKVSVDPFARNKRWATFTNDLNPTTAAEYHMEAVAFIESLVRDGVKADLIIHDPPYSPRQISECYSSIEKKATTVDTQGVQVYSGVRNAIMPLLTDSAIVLSFGWNTIGMGKKNGFEIEEIMRCCHGSTYNDTICMAERRIG